MKNTKYFPFERNNYFYGKLLSVNDFRLEQKYGNDKRRMLNRFLSGTGVVVGMNVVAVDDTTVLVESGLALDNFGREIVIDEPVVRGLPTLEGFSDYEENRETGYLYLCVAYEEEEAEAVHTISHGGQREKESFNKIREGYRLFLTRSEPESENLSSRNLFESVQTVYWGKGIRIRQILPRFVQGKDRVELKIQVENMGQQEHFAFSYELDLTCLTFEGRSLLTVTFDEVLFEKAGRYTFSYELDALGVSESRAGVSLVPDSFKLRIGNNQTSEKAQAKVSLQIGADTPMEQARRNYYEKGMEQIGKDGSSQNLYLAKISLLRAGHSVVIDQIEKMPFGQYVATPYLQDALFCMAEQEWQKEDGKAGGESEQKRKNRPDPYGLTVSEGVEELELGIGSGKGRRIFSREISHGLGMGRTTIVLSLEGEESQEDYFGAPGIFQNDLPQVELAAKADAQKGTFVIGVQVLAATVKERIRIHWTAIQDRKELTEKKERRIFIRPNVLNLNTRESYYLEAVCSNMADTGVLWQVKDHGGTINENGMYTAPNTAGVYEVTAISAADPSVKASIFVIVREKGA